MRTIRPLIVLACLLVAGCVYPYDYGGYPYGYGGYGYGGYGYPAVAVAPTVVVGSGWGWGGWHGGWGGWNGWHGGGWGSGWHH